MVPYFTFASFCHTLRTGHTQLDTPQGRPHRKRDEKHTHAAPTCCQRRGPRVTQTPHATVHGTQHNCTIRPPEEMYAARAATHASRRGGQSMRARVGRRRDARLALTALPGARRVGVHTRESAMPQRSRGRRGRFDQGECLTSAGLLHTQAVHEPVRVWSVDVAEGIKFSSQVKSEISNVKN